MEALQNINIMGREFQIKYTQGGDLKWLATMHGINAANSTHPCIWCNWAAKRENPRQVTRIEARTHAKCREKLQEARQNTDGYKEMPLIQFIEFKHAIVDLLHMCLRITDNLFEKLISHLDYLDRSSNFD